MSNSDPKTRPRPGPWPPLPEESPIPPSTWAKKTGFRPKFSGETNASDSGQISLPPPRPPREPEAQQPDLEAGRVRNQPVVANGEPVRETIPAQAPKPHPTADKDQTVKRRKDSDGGSKNAGHGPNGQAVAVPVAVEPNSQPRRPLRSEEVVDVLPNSVDDDGYVARHSHMKYELRDTPGLGEFFFCFPTCNVFFY